MTLSIGRVKRLVLASLILASLVLIPVEAKQDCNGTYDCAVTALFMQIIRGEQPAIEPQPSQTVDQLMNNTESVNETVKQFPCRKWESTKSCTIRALHEDVFGERSAWWKFV